MDNWIFVFGGEVVGFLTSSDQWTAIFDLNHHQIVCFELAFDHYFWPEYKYSSCYYSGIVDAVKLRLLIVAPGGDFSFWSNTAAQWGKLIRGLLAGCHCTVGGSQHWQWEMLDARSLAFWIWYMGGRPNPTETGLKRWCFNRTQLTYLQLHS